MRDFRLVEQVSRFFDVAVSLADLVVSGRLEQYPDLELIAATTGGGVALIHNRLDAVQRGRPPAEGVTRAELRRSPSEYLRNVYVDTANQNPASQLANIELMGPERMLFGTDSPPLATPLEEAIGMVRQLPVPRGSAERDPGRQRAAAVRARRGPGMSAGWDDFRAEMHRALAEQVEGRSEPYKALWSQKDPVMVMGAEGGCDRGWEKASAGIDVASRMIQGGNRTIENLVTTVGDEVAVTVDFEHVILETPGLSLRKTLRCTHAYRVEDGEWRIFLRHADEYDPEGLRAGPPRGGPPGGGPPGGGPPGGGPPEEDRREEDRQEEVRREEARRVEGRQEEDRQEEDRQEEARQEEARQEEARQEEARRGGGPPGGPPGRGRHREGRREEPPEEAGQEGPAGRRSARGGPPGRGRREGPPGGGPPGGPPGGSGGSSEGPPGGGPPGGGPPGGGPPGGGRPGPPGRAAAG